MLDYARNAHKRGIKVIIAGAGGAAHLPGMVAALTPLPTVGVPVTPAGAHLDGLDALLSIVQVRAIVQISAVLNVQLWHMLFWLCWCCVGIAAVCIHLFGCHAELYFKAC